MKATVATEEDWIRSLTDRRREAAGPNPSPFEATGTMIAVLSSIHRGAGMWTWLGPREYRPKGVSLEISIAQYLGLQPPVEQVFERGLLTPITAGEAKSLLAYLVHDGLQNTAWGRSTPQAGPALIKVLDDGFSPFGSEVQCFTNGDYHLAATGEPQKRGHMPLTGATVDTGVICHDGSVGFAFWVDSDP